MISKSRVKTLSRTGIALILWPLCLALIYFSLVYLLKHSPEPIGSRADLFVSGAQTTLLLTIVSGAIGLLIGILVGLARMHRAPLLHLSARAYVGLLRGTPLLVQILFAYFALPALFPALRLNEFSAAALALAMNVGAYNAEVIRAGVLAVPRGQAEAARSLGLSRFGTMRWVVMPQALRLVTPPLVNNLVALLKDSALASSIGLLDLSLAGSRVSSETFQPVASLTTVACIYLLLTTVFSGMAHYLERNLRS